MQVTAFIVENVNKKCTFGRGHISCSFVKLNLTFFTFYIKLRLSAAHPCIAALLEPMQTIKDGSSFMTKEKVTIQDIADALGISRNTASKALNGNDSIPEATRIKVVNKAMELKYKQFAFMHTDLQNAKSSGNITLFTSNMPSNSHFGSLLLSGMEKKFSGEGYNISIHIIREEEISSVILPNNFDPDKVEGIVCIEMFDKAYNEMITRLGIPTIFIDSYADIVFADVEADVILMENEHSVHTIVKKLIDHGHTRFGFVGDYRHCKSFNERWAGLNRCLSENGLRLDLSMCIVESDRHFYLESAWMDDQLDKMDMLPSAFVCANDFIAVRLVRALKNRNLHIPEDVCVVGFDDAMESRVVEPQLTTRSYFQSGYGDHYS